MIGEQAVPLASPYPADRRRCNQVEGSTGKPEILGFSPVTGRATGME